MNKIKDIGKMALGSRLRTLSEILTEDATSIYKLYEVPFKPKWFPVFYTISKNKTMSIGNIAQEIGHSHPSVVKIVQELKEGGFVTASKDKDDARKSNIVLTPFGIQMANKMQGQYQDVNAAVEDLLENQTYNLWKALDELEFSLSEKSMYKRVLEQKKRRESKLVEIVDYLPIYESDFKRLNQAWIEQYFKIEASDLKALEAPNKYIITPGGAILIALYEKEVAGVCALIKMEGGQYDYELAKMAVSSNHQGKGIGSILGQAIIDKARSLGAKKLYLESNTILQPAINLYKKLGFKKIKGVPSPYERCNIQMELLID